MSQHYSDHYYAVIMAGGMGERLRPLTDVRAKPAVPFGAIFRIIDFALSNCINSGIRQILVLTQYKSRSLSRHLSTGFSFLSQRLDEFIEEIPAQMQLGSQWYKGTADAIRQNLGFINSVASEHVLILAGDHIYKMNYREMIAFWDTVVVCAMTGLVLVNAGDWQQGLTGAALTPAQSQSTDMFRSTLMKTIRLPKWSIEAFADSTMFSWNGSPVR